MPLSADTRIPVTADWLITMVEPTDKLKEMYIEDVVNGPSGQTNTSLTTNQILISELVEVAPIDIGAPDCKWSIHLQLKKIKL